MFINYEEKELNYLFKSDPVYIYEKETGMFIYSFSDINGIKITINVSIYEKEIILLLSQKEKIILENKLKNVESLLLEKDHLRIHQNDTAQDIIIYFTPNILVNYIDN